MEKNLKIALWLGLILIGFIGSVFIFSSDRQTVESISLKKFNSYDELKSFLKENTNQNAGAAELFGATSKARSADAGSALQAGASANTGTRADSFSQTNIQVEGVDEPDVVKNDGKYIYQIVQGNKVVIVDAFPASEMKLVSEINFTTNSIAGIFVKDNKLIVLETVYGYSYGYASTGSASDAVVSTNSVSGGVASTAKSVSSGEGSAAGSMVAPPASQSEVRVHVYDLTDIAKPKLEDTFVSKGNYYTARMIKGVVYVVSSYYANADNPVIPVFASDAGVRDVAVSNIYYPVISDQSFLFTSVLSVNSDKLEFSGNVFLTGSNGVSYVSRDALYLTHQKSFDYQNFQKDMIKEVFLPLLPSDTRAEVKNILDGDGQQNEKSQKMEQAFAKYFNTLSIEEKQAFQNELQTSMADFASSWSKKYQRTEIHKIALDGLDVSYSGSGEVPGYLLNQFSLDENDGYLRVATTTNNNGWGFGPVTLASSSVGTLESTSAPIASESNEASLGAVASGERLETQPTRAVAATPVQAQRTQQPAGPLNHLFILNGDLEIVGSVEDLAPGERIYSARFVGDKAYMVTFRQVDPLYVIDVSNPKNPKVLGYLKVTGFSNYLQPYDENHLIGIGRDATLQGRAQGLKISLFDVSDFENPREVDSYIFEGSWSYSEAEYEHKAVLFDKEKNLLVIPVTTNDYNYNTYWQGAYIFNVDKSGISLRGKIDHRQDNSNVEGYGYGQGYVRRSLYLDDVLYTISEQRIKANDLNSLQEIKSLDIPWKYASIIVA